MSEKRRGLGRGLGALIPEAGQAAGGAGRGSARPTDVFWPGTDTVVGAEPAEASPESGIQQTAPSGRGADSDGGGSEPRDATQDRTSEPGSAPDGGSETEAAGAVDVAAAGLAPVPGAVYREVPVGSIRPNPRQPRTVFDEDDMAELVHSIREIGVLQPIVVRQVPDEGGAPRFELVMGERRWRASVQADRETIPAIIKETEDDTLLRDALLENLHRSELNPLEEAAAYQQLLDDFGCTQEELAGRIGRSRPQISNTLRLLRLPPMVARRVAAGVLSAGHARALLTLDDGAAMERLAQRIVAEGLSVRSVEEIVALGVDPERPARAGRTAGEPDPRLDDLAARLSDRFDTRARVTLGKRKGRMTIEFASREDLDRILDQMGVDTTEL